jgi:hypothetical protein
VLAPFQLETISWTACKRSSAGCLRLRTAAKRAAPADSAPSVLIDAATLATNAAGTIEFSICSMPLMAVA